YDIDARSDIRAEDREFPAMMQALLTDRFHLRFHREARELPVYELVAVKRGPKLTPASKGESGSTRRNGAGPLVIKSGTLVGLASPLSTILARKVFDTTGLTGNYDMTLMWTPDDYQPPPLRPNGPPPDPNNPSIFTVIQEQLGLKLESAKGPVE